MEISLGWKIAGWILLIAVALTFAFEAGWAFMAAAVLMIAWVVGVLNQAARSNRSG